MRFIDKGGACDYTSTVVINGVQKSIECKGGFIETKDEAVIGHIMKFPKTYDIAPEAIVKDEPNVESFVSNGKKQKKNKEQL